MPSAAGCCSIFFVCKIFISIYSRYAVLKNEPRIKRTNDTMCGSRTSWVTTATNGFSWCHSGNIYYFLSESSFKFIVVPCNRNGVHTPNISKLFGDAFRNHIALAKVTTVMILDIKEYRFNLHTYDLSPLLLFSTNPNSFANSERNMRPILFYSTGLIAWCLHISCYKRTATAALVIIRHTQ